MPTLLSTLPPDIILKICRFCTQWRDVFSLRKVSRLFDAFFQQREIWADLVSACVNPAHEPSVCFLERPLYTYNTADLQRIFKRWKTSEIGLKTFSVEQVNCTTRILDLEYPLVSTWSLLAPGGRWLISFTRSAAAVYHDLDSPASKPCLLIPSQLSVHVPWTGIDLSEFDVDEDSPYLTFRVALSYRPDEANKLVSVVQIWKVSALFDHSTQESRLVAHRLKLFRLRFGRIRIISLIGNYLLVNACELNPGDGIIVNEKLLLINWSIAPEGEEPLVKLLLFNNDHYRRPSLLRNGAVVRSTVDGIFLYDLSDLEHYTGARPESIASLYLDRTGQCYHKAPMSEGYFPILSNPFYPQIFQGMNALQEQAEIILLDQTGMGSIRIEDYHARIYGRSAAGPAPYRLLGRFNQEDNLHNLTGLNSSEYFCQLDEIIFGRRHALLRINDQLELLSVAGTSEKEERDEGDMLVVSNPGISVSFNQVIHFDESIGRVVVLSEDRQSCRIYDFNESV